MEHSYFSSSYFEARAKFRELAARQHAGISSHRLPLARAETGAARSARPASIHYSTVDGGESRATAPNALSSTAWGRQLPAAAAPDQALTMDVAWLGPPTPRAALIVTSGTHGVEGFAGSGFQCSLLAAESLRELEPDVAVILVHAINPFGFAHVCRVNELNIDLNRNFIDFDMLPASPGYDALHSAIVPAAWTGVARSRADRFLGDAWDTLGERGFQQAVCLGQYAHADGLFYGGNAPSWSNVAWRSCLARLPRSIEMLAHIDIHTGLGPYGYGELIYSLPMRSPAYALASEWYEGLDLCAAGSLDSAATSIGGTMNHAILEANLAAQVTSISLEFGTVDFRRMFEALRADNWLRTRAPEGFADAAEIRQELLSCFFPEDSDWDHAVVERCNQVFTRTLAGLNQHVRTTQRKSNGK